ncbi:cell division protein FtsL [Rothia dentocariosa]
MEIPGAERRWDTMSFYDYVETTQALLVSFALTDGAAQAVSYIMSFASSLIKLLK